MLLERERSEWLNRDPRSRGNYTFIARCDSWEFRIRSKYAECPVAASLCTPTVCHFRRASRWNVFSVFGLRVLFATTTHVRGVGFDSISALDEDINGRRPVSIANQGQQYPGLYIYIYIYIPRFFCCVDSTCGHSEPTRHLRVDRFIFPPSSRQDECGAYRRSPDGDSARGAG